MKVIEGGEMEQEQRSFCDDCDFIVKSLLILAGVLFITGLYWLLKNKVGDLRPALLPGRETVVSEDNGGAASKGGSSQAPSQLKPTNQSQQALGRPVGFSLNIEAGFSLSVFANQPAGARDLVFSPGGTLLVSSPKNKAVYVLPDKDKDGYFDQAKVLADDLNNPHGLAFYQDQLFIAEETRLTRWNWDEQSLEVEFDQELFSLPTGGRHYTRTIAFNDLGQMFVSIGSSCDVCFEDNPWHGSIIVSDADGTQPQIYAQGLRNAVFMQVRPNTDQLWVTEMGRDWLGDNKPPDEINLVGKDNHYGWPVCYGDRVYDQDFGQRSADFCNQTTPPKFEIQAHSAPLGLEFINSERFPDSWQNDLIVAYHGSWNRSEPVGYKLVRLELDGDRIIAEHDFVTGFLKEPTAAGRPVDVELGPEGILYISDDKSGAIYQIY